MTLAVLPLCFFFFFLKQVLFHSTTHSSFLTAFSVTVAITKEKRGKAHRYGYERRPVPDGPRYAQLFTFGVVHPCFNVDQSLMEFHFDQCLHVLLANLLVATNGLKSISGPRQWNARSDCTVKVNTLNLERLHSDRSWFACLNQLEFGHSKSSLLTVWWIKHLRRIDLRRR